LFLPSLSDGSRPAVLPSPQVFGTDVNGLPLSLDLSWLEQKAVIILLTLLHLGVKNVRSGGLGNGIGRMVGHGSRWEGLRRAGDGDTWRLAPGAKPSPPPRLADPHRAQGTCVPHSVSPQGCGGQIQLAGRAGERPCEKKEWLSLSCLEEAQMLRKARVFYPSPCWLYPCCLLCRSAIPKTQRQMWRRCLPASEGKWSAPLGRQHEPSAAPKAATEAACSCVEPPNPGLGSEMP